uniref:Insulin like growth factor binding protein 1 n=1 Tax=Ficedula albicollis TaxID=59894 RepID=U3KFG4_FICAL
MFMRTEKTSKSKNKGLNATPEFSGCAPTEGKKNYMQNTDFLVILVFTILVFLQGPCQKELYRALYKLVKARQRSRGEIYKFYLPNCNKNGFYHSKQCETLLDGESAECWCVYPKNGRRIPGSPEIKGDPECQQYLSSQDYN